MTTLDIIQKLSSEEKTRFIICNEWLVERNGNKVGINHTYYFKGESFNNIDDAIKYLKKKVNYLVKRGCELTID